MASRDERPAVVCDAAAEQARLTRHTREQAHKRFFWLQGPMGSVSFTLNAGRLSTFMDPWGDCGYHSLAPREGWSETVACGFLGDGDGWCDWNSALGAQLLGIFATSGEEALYAALAGIYQAIFG